MFASQRNQYRENRGYQEEQVYLSDRVSERHAGDVTVPKIQGRHPCYEGQVTTSEGATLVVHSLEPLVNPVGVWAHREVCRILVNTVEDGIQCSSPQELLLSVG